ncbi:unnamed protein product [Thlaspi arvense]|uniref:Brix domain-containing protein n=1 Tax=Thlaspi arvense TaxID=13288 RepID=A0AAU9RTI5_THLAR|nr:unnamed protein product [Thlaspi arvense]
MRNKKGRVSVKPIVKKNQANVDHVTGDKIPKTLDGFEKAHASLHCSQSKGEEAEHFKRLLECVRSNGCSHFLMLSKTESALSLRVARTPQGPTLTFKIHQYSLASDIARSQLRPRCPQDLFKSPPLIVLSGFGTQELHLKLATIMFQNIFPSIDINTVKLSTCQRLVLLHYNKDTKLVDFRHYSIRLQPVGVSRMIRKFVQNHQVPDLRNLQDVSDYVTNEGDEEAATVTLSSDLGRVNRSSTKSAVKLQEIGPRMTMQLVKVEEGLCSGGIIFSEYENVDEKKAQKKQDGDEEEDGDDDSEEEEGEEGSEEDGEDMDEEDLED